MRRIVDLSGSLTSDPGLFRVRLDKGCLLIAHGVDEHPEETRIPAHEIAVLMLGHRLALTGAVLGAVTANGGAVVSLDDRFRPVGLMLPIEGNKAHAARLRLQIEKLPALAPALWRQVVVAKIEAQAATLDVLARGREQDLWLMGERVESGDATNVEATAARVYWGALFGEGFKRHADDEVNIALNYGYACLRALVARAVVASGLHPALGLHHRTDVFALADDLMEPARPLVDRIVVAASPRALSPALKRQLVSVAVADVEIGGGRWRLIEAYEKVCQSLVAAIAGERADLDLPATGELS